jgi:hypothetical protein
LDLKLPAHFDQLHLRAGGRQASVPDALENEERVLYPFATRSQEESQGGKRTEVKFYPHLEEAKEGIF